MKGPERGHIDRTPKLHTKTCNTVTVLCGAVTTPRNKQVAALPSTQALKNLPHTRATHNPQGCRPHLCTCKCRRLCTHMPDACFTHPDDVNVFIAFIAHVTFFRRSVGNRMQGRDHFLYLYHLDDFLLFSTHGKQSPLCSSLNTMSCAGHCEVRTVCVRGNVGFDETPVRVVVLFLAVTLWVLLFLVVAEASPATVRPSPSSLQRSPYLRGSSRGQLRRWPGGRFSSQSPVCSCLRLYDGSTLLSSAQLHHCTPTPLPPDPPTGPRHPVAAQAPGVGRASNNSRSLSNFCSKCTEQTRRFVCFVRNAIPQWRQQLRSHQRDIRLSLRRPTPLTTNDIADAPWALVTTCPTSSLKKNDGLDWLQPWSTLQLLHHNLFGPRLPLPRL